MKTRTKCIVCGEPFFEKPLFVCRDMPAKSQDLPTKDTLHDDKPIDFNVCQCSRCGLVQFDCEPVDYYRDSTRAGERCDALIKMRRKQYSYLIEKYSLQNKKILEVGAGKGGFLKTLKEMTEYNISEYGIEYNSEFVRIAREQEGVNVIQGNPEDANFKIAGAPFDAFVSFAYPARLVDPNSMLQGVYNNLIDGGVGFIQVPSMEHLIEPGGFFDITADHIAYYSIDTLRFLLQKNGFEVLEHGEVGGIYIYAIVKKRQPYDLKTIWKDVTDISIDISDYVNGAIKNNRKIAVWCAGHFAFTVLSLAGIGDKIEYVVDNAKFKQNCFTPASHVKIVGPDYYEKNPVDVVLILGPLYVDEIVNEIRNRYGSEIKIATLGKNGIKEIV